VFVTVTAMVAVRKHRAFFVQEIDDQKTSVLTLCKKEDDLQLNLLAANEQDFDERFVMDCMRLHPCEGQANQTTIYVTSRDV
jgi:hypothetical protein